MNRPRRSLATAGLALALAFCAAGLAGCGFTPLYATPGLSPALASMDVVAPQTRQGFLLKEQLNEELARDADTPARYRLILTVKESRFPRGIRVNNIANRYEIGLTVGYVLTDSVTGKVLVQGAAPVEVSYDAADQPYAGVAANQDGEVRAANQAAILIRLKLARYFETLAEPRPPATP